MAEQKKKKALLSKSTFIKGLQCPKALYLYKNRYFLRDPLDPEQRAKFARGTDVGIYAQKLYPGGVDASPKSHFQMAKSVEKTQQLLQQPEVSVIYEAAFAHNDVVIALDILVRENGSWKAIEVKSSRAVSSTYQWDAALQYYVISGSGLPLKDFCIAYINQDYQRQGEIDPSELFCMESVWDFVQSKNEEISQKVEELKAVTKLKRSPDIAIGIHCNHPYPCEFRGHCWKKVPQDSVFVLDGPDDSQKFEWYHAGIQRVSDLDKPTQEKFAPQIQSIQRRKPVIHKTPLRNYLSHGNTKQGLLQIFYFAPVIPFFEHTYPYQVLPFGLAFSPSHTYTPEFYLDTTGQWPLPAALQKIAQWLNGGHTIWVCSEKEKSTLEEWINAQPAYQLNSEKPAPPHTGSPLDNDPQKTLAQTPEVSQEPQKDFASRIQSLQQIFLNEYVVFPSRNKKDSCEDILRLLGKIPEEFPPKLQIPQEADALFQKICQLDSPDEKQAGFDLLQQYMEAKTRNLFSMYELLNELAEE